MPAASMMRLSEPSWNPWAANSAKAAPRIVCCWAVGSLAKRGRTMEGDRSGGRKRGQFDGVAQAAAHHEIRQVRQAQEPDRGVADGELHPPAGREPQPEPLGGILFGLQQWRQPGV